MKKNHTGIHYGPGAGELRSNEISNSVGNGIELFSTTSATIVENESSNNGGNGIFIAAGAKTKTIWDNKAHGNGDVDLFDGNSTNASTIERKTPINRSVNENERCGASNQWVRRNAFWLPMVSFERISALAAIVSQHNSIETSVGNDLHYRTR